MAGLTSPTSIRIGPMGQFNPMVPMFNDNGQSAANQILGAYGLQMPQLSADPVFQNTQNGDGSFLGEHPGVRSALSGAIMGAAFTPTSRTVGEGISNVARGMLGGQDFARQRALQQFMAPFNVAGTLSEIQARQGQLDYLKGLGSFYGHRLDNQRQVLATHQTREGKMFNVMEDGSTEWIKDPEGNVLIGPPTPSQRPAAGAHPGGLQGQIVESLVGPPPDGSDPAALATWGQNAARVYTHLQSSLAGGRTAADLGAKYDNPHVVPPDQAARVKMYSDQAKADIKGTENLLKEASKHPYSQKQKIEQLQQELDQKKQAYGGYAGKLLDGEDMQWGDYLKSIVQPPPTSAPSANGNPFRR